MGGHQPNIFETIVNSPTTQDTPFNQSDSQESKLLKVRDQLRNEIRTHKHNDMSADILSIENRCVNLEKEVQLLLSVVTAHSNQLNTLSTKEGLCDEKSDPKPKNEYGHGRIVPGYTLISNCVNRMRANPKLTKSVANSTVFAGFLIKMGLITEIKSGKKNHARYAIVPSEDNPIIENPNYKNYRVTNRSGFEAQFLIESRYFETVILPYFLEYQSKIDSIKIGDYE